RSDETRTDSRNERRVHEPASSLASFRLLLRRLAEGLQVFQRQLPAVQQLRHYTLRRSAEQAEDVVEDPPVRGLLRDRRLKQERVADLTRPFDRALLLQAVHDRLH